MNCNEFIFNLTIPLDMSNVSCSAPKIHFGNVSIFIIYIPIPIKQKKHIACSILGFGMLNLRSVYNSEYAKKYGNVAIAVVSKLCF